MNWVRYDALGPRYPTAAPLIKEIISDSSIMKVQTFFCLKSLRQGFRMRKSSYGNEIKMQVDAGHDIGEIPSSIWGSLKTSE